MEPRANQLVTCPFNMAHQVEHYRIQVHLAKCQKQYPNQRIVTCPFDATHYVKAEELNHHVTHCRAREMMDSQVYVTDDDHRPIVQIQAQPVSLDTGSGENWDDDNVETYKPLEAKKQSFIYNKIKGATKSERNKFRFQSSLQYSSQEQQRNFNKPDEN